MAWRKLLATFIGTSGLLFAVTAYFSSVVVPNSAEWFAQTALAAIGLVAAIISIFLWRGNYIALWILRLASILTIACALILALVDFASANHLIEPPIGSIAFYAWIISFPLFFLLLLWQPQVVAEFRVRVNEP